MPQAKSNFVWYELMTTDLEGAQAFYRSVLGWTTQDAGMPGMQYVIASAGSIGVGGMMTLPAEAAAGGAPAAWVGYVAVDDVDAAAARLVQAGGSVHMPPTDIPGVGRFAAVADPQGAGFDLFKNNSTEPAPQIAPGSVGHVGWHELSARDNKAAFDFYATQFGWTEVQAMDMGPMGVYRMFATDGAPVGGMMDMENPSSAPGWLFYFNVDAIDAAAARVTSAGGKVLGEPHEVPGGSWIISCNDAQGVAFALVAPKR